MPSTPARTIMYWYFVGRCLGGLMGVGVFVGNSVAVVLASVLWGISFIFVLTLVGFEMEMLVWWPLGLSLLVLA